MEASAFEAIFFEPSKTDSSVDRELFKAAYDGKQAAMAGLPEDFVPLSQTAASRSVPDLDYGNPLPHRLDFNKSFQRFQDLAAGSDEKEAFAKTRGDFLKSIEAADNFMQSAEAVFYKQIDAAHMKSGKPSLELIEKLQTVSAELNMISPPARNKFMHDLAAGDLSDLSGLPELKAAYEQVFDSFALLSKNDLMSSWFNYRMSMGDSIGQRQVYAGLSRRFGSAQEADRHDAKVLELKERVGGRYLWY